MPTVGLSPDSISLLDVGAHDGWVANQLSYCGFTNMTAVEPRAHDVACGMRLRDLLGPSDGVTHVVGDQDAATDLPNDPFVRAENRKAILASPLSSRIRLVEGSSTAEAVVKIVLDAATAARTVLVVLDSDRTRAHVRSELALYAPSCLSVLSA